MTSEYWVMQAWKRPPTQTVTSQSCFTPSHSRPLLKRLKHAPSPSDSARQAAGGPHMAPSPRSGYLLNTEVMSAPVQEDTICCTGSRSGMAAGAAFSAIQQLSAPHTPQLAISPRLAGLPYTMFTPPGRPRRCQHGATLGCQAPQPRPPRRTSPQ